jgi:hypothetical protein
MELCDQTSKDKIVQDILAYCLMEIIEEEI